MTPRPAPRLRFRRRLAPRHCVPNSPFIVDGFRAATRDADIREDGEDEDEEEEDNDDEVDKESPIFFLTHFHSDHYAG